jgi:hypothetical protein
VPLDLHRRAAQLLEDVRGTDSAPNWASATLAPDVQPLYRPDILGVAYYEFRVVVGTRPAGFIIVSTGAHDYPIAHWNFDGLSPTQLLIREGGTAATTFYKLDSLSYAAEDAQGELVAKQGGLPQRIVGQKPEWLDRTVEGTDVTWVPEVPATTDREASRATFRQDVQGPTIPESIELTGWSSWKELKDNFRGTYAVMAESLKRQAANEWETETLVRDSGEGLLVDRPLDVALPYARPEVTLSGEGAQVVRSAIVDTAVGKKLVLSAFASRPGTELPLTVSIRYYNGVVETLRFVVVDRSEVGTLSAEGSSGSKSSGSEDVRWADMLGAWSPWSESFAGTHGHQRLYSQFASGSSPNTSSCYSGCGATAWAMLFGWGDHQAALNNPAWAHRFGLYRVNGGVDTADADAPQSMDTGVRNMTWELRNRVGTFCNPFNDSGATAPWNMDGASGYLKNRTGASLSTHYNVLGIHEDRLRNKARDSIRDRHVPAIIGTGWLTHYPLAYGYRVRSRTVKKCFIWCWNDTQYQRQFYVNQGWGGSNNGWVGEGTWFAGQLYAN